MARYVLKNSTLGLLFPAEVEAEVWWKNGDHPLDYAEPRATVTDGAVVAMPGEEARKLGWEGGVVRYFRRPDVPGEQRCPRCNRLMHDHGWLDQGGEGLTVCPGDYVVDAGFHEDRQMRVAVKLNLMMSLYERVP